MLPDLPDWNELRDILAIAEEGSLSAAARTLGVSQSTMSRRLAAIEAGGRPVFARDGAGPLTPTGRGTVLIAAAREMRAALGRAAAELAEAPAPLRVASCEVTARLFLADALADWARRQDRPADHSVHDDLFSLSRGRFDVLVSPGIGPGADQEGERIGAIDWALYAAPEYLAAHPFASGDGLVAHRIIRASGSLARIDAYQWLAGQGGATSLLSSSPLAQLEACRRGQGIALLPVGLVGGTGLERLDHPVPPPSHVWMLADAREASHPRIAGFLRWARGHFRKAPETTVA